MLYRAYTYHNTAVFVGQEVEKSLQNVQRGKRRVEDKSEDYRERAAELQDTVEKLSVSSGETVGE